MSRISQLVLMLPLLLLAAGKKPDGNSDAPAADMPLYQSKYYKVYTDIDPSAAREACIRMTRMAEEYHARTSGFAGDIREKLPFYLFKSADEYYAAGGMAKSAGVFNGTRLMAMADPRVGKQVWHIVQHEGFHQFVHAVIGGEIPVWVNEGMAEYFGEAIFTGDGFVTGIVPPFRLARIKKTLLQSGGENHFKSIDAMMRLSHARWNLEMNIENYDQAWSMIHFLAHGENGKYQQAFESYMTLVSRGKSSQDAWSSVFGNDSASFERQWKTFWTSQSPNPTSELYARATVAILTSFLSRAVDQKQSFDGLDEFIHLAESNELKQSVDEWLPPSLLAAALRDVAHRQQIGDKFSMSITNKRQPSIIDQTSEGLHVAGVGRIEEGRVTQVAVTITGKKHPATQAASGGPTEGDSGHDGVSTDH